MNLPDEHYTIETFHKFLLSNARQYLQQLKLVCLVVYFPSLKNIEPLTIVDQLFRKNEFEIREKGEIRQYSRAFIDPKTGNRITVILYCYVDSSDGILKCFTTNKTEDVERFLNGVVDEGGLYYLWINPESFEDLRHKLLSYPSTTITYFSASRPESTRLPAEIRPDEGRTLVYYSDDGDATLPELRKLYGVVADIIRFRIPGHADVQISRRGFFTYYGGDFDFILEVSKIAIDLALRSKGIFDSSRVLTIPFSTAGKKLELNQFNAWIIEFARQLDANEVNQLFAELRHDDFAVYNSIVLAGSLHGEGTIYDEIYRTIFTVSVQPTRIVVSPRYNTSSESFVRFFRSVTERFDPNATAKGPIEQNLG